MRYSHVRWFSERGAVNAVPDTCSVYRLNGTNRGLFRPTGSEPATTSLSNALPNPRRYLSFENSLSGLLAEAGDEADALIVKDSVLVALEVYRDVLNGKQWSDESQTLGCLSFEILS